MLGSWCSNTDCRTNSKLVPTISGNITEEIVPPLFTVTGSFRLVLEDDSLQFLYGVTSPDIRVQGQSCQTDANGYYLNDSTFKYTS